MFKLIYFLLICLLFSFHCASIDSPATENYRITDDRLIGYWVNEDSSLINNGYVSVVKYSEGEYVFWLRTRTVKGEKYGNDQILKGYIGKLNNYSLFFFEKLENNTTGLFYNIFSYEFISDSLVKVTAIENKTTLKLDEFSISSYNSQKTLQKIEKEIIEGNSQTYRKIRFRPE